LETNLGAYFSLLMKNHLVSSRLGLVFYECMFKDTLMLGHVCNQPVFKKPTFRN
jgi:hypothetical protein